MKPPRPVLVPGLLPCISSDQVPTAAAWLLRPCAGLLAGHLVRSHQGPLQKWAFCRPLLNLGIVLVLVTLYLGTHPS